jgi:hypothetical protein
MEDDLNVFRWKMTILVFKLENNLFFGEIERGPILIEILRQGQFWKMEDNIIFIT